MIDFQLFLIPGNNYAVSTSEYVPAAEQFGEDFAGAEFHETRTLLADGGDRFGVSTTIFDTVEELMWMGNQGVHCRSRDMRDSIHYGLMTLIHCRVT